MPTSRGRIHEPPKSTTSPRFEKISLNRARSEAMIEVAAEREVAARARGHAVDRGDRRLREIVQTERGLPDRPHAGQRAADAPRRLRGAAVAEIGARAEAVARAGDHEHAVVGIRRDRFEEVDQPAPHLAA